MPLPKVEHPTPEEIRKRFSYVKSCWAEQRKEAAKDRRFVAIGPWDEGELRDRTKVERLALVFDELSQYTHKAINGVRSNKRGVNVQPAGGGATQKTALLNKGLITQIAYESNADYARIKAYEDAVIGGEGYYKIVREYESDESDNQVLREKSISNPACIYFDPAACEADFSDAADCFEIDKISSQEFKDQYPDADRKTFTLDDTKLYDSWVDEDSVRIASYWKVHKIQKKAYKFKKDMRFSDDGPTKDEYSSDEIPEGVKVKREDLRRDPRIHYERVVVQYITNGVEILEINTWTAEVKGPTTNKPIRGGTMIPIVPVLGEEVCYEEGGKTIRQWYGIFRRARGAFKAYCWARTREFELIQMASLAPYVAYEGQMQGHEKEWQKANREPVAFLYFKGRTDDTGAEVLPAPQRPAYSADIAAVDSVAESARRSIQTAIGISNPLPQRRSSAPLSGTAVDKFNQLGDLSNYHFPDNFDRAIACEGRILVDLLPITYDTAREAYIAQEHDEEAKAVQLNDPNAQNEQGEPDVYALDVGKHSVTVTSGQDSDSLNDEARNTADTLLSPQLVTMALQQPQSTAAKVLALTIEMKQLGPIGDKLAETISPEQDSQVPPQIQQAMQTQQKQLQDATALAGHLKQDLEQRISIRQAELESSERINASKLENDRILHADDNRTKLVIAEIGAKSKMLDVAADANAQQLEFEQKRIEHQMDMLHESELAPNPAEGPQGLHPSEPPPDPNAPPPGQQAAQPAEVPSNE